MEPASERERERDWVRHLEDENQVSEIRKLETEKPKWPHAFMNVPRRKHLCLSASWLTNWIQAYFHHSGCIWIGVKVTRIKGFDLSMQWGLGWHLYFWSVKSFVQCKVDLPLRRPWVAVDQLRVSRESLLLLWLPPSCGDWSRSPPSSLWGCDAGCPPVLGG